MLPNIGITEGLILAFIVLLLFGARRLPEIGASLGKGIREFKSSVKEVQADARVELQDTVSNAARPDETGREEQRDHSREEPGT
ncbi:MAG: twin-arginine translocase TatA/TatE family subunit [Gemmatimonadota bacterium]|nr:twin-arginine translocase TatA/TatE family subunit [Gemmatimonadota bacterium]MDH3427247.1 twin-arginine translocase TatA/TatE family subunit [Gemmatimonadota bacterium]